jgi:hypothetical protein
MPRIRMRTTIDQAIPIERTAAQKPALLTGLRPHRRQHTLTSTSHLPLSLRTEQHHQRLMDWAVQFNRTTGLG